MHFSLEILINPWVLVVCVGGRGQAMDISVERYMEYTQTNIVLIIIRGEKMNKSMEHSAK